MGEKILEWEKELNYLFSSLRRGFSPGQQYFDESLDYAAMDYPHDNVFSAKQLPLHGNSYLTKFRDLPKQARASCGRLRRLWHAISPAIWLDKLTKDQEPYYHFISSDADWARVRDVMAEEVAEFPGIGVSVVLQEGQTKPAYLSISTHVGRVATFSMLALAHTVQGWTREEELIPEDVLVWLREPQYFVLVSGLSAFFENPPEGYQATSIVDTEAMFAHYQASGVIRHDKERLEGGTAHQMVFSFGYHHLPTTEEEFRSLVGEVKYETWPQYRHPGWRPIAVYGELQPEESFFHYCQGVSVWGFVFRLAMHGILYGGIPFVEKVLPYEDLLTVFLGANLVDPAERAAATEAMAPQVEEVEQAAAARTTPDGRAADKPGDVSTGRKPRNRRDRRDSPSKRSDVMDLVSEDELVIDDDDLDWASHTEEQATASSDREQPMDAEETGVALPTTQPGETSVRDRLGPKEEPQPGPSRSRDDRNKDSAGQEAPTDDNAWRHDPADLRSRLLLIAHSYELKEKRGGEEGAVSVRQDLNTQFRARQLNRRDNDPFLLSMVHKLPFWENSFLKRPPGLKPSKDILGYDILTPREIAENPFVDKPRFHRQCEFCSSQHCSKYAKGSNSFEICLKFKEHNNAAPSRDECLYLRCHDRKSHHVPICPALHSRCSVCGLRGHGPQDLCDVRNPAIMERLRADFEQWARLGTYTKDRKTQVAWGFYKFTKKAVSGSRPPADYVDLTDMDVLDALATVDALNLAAEMRTDSGQTTADNNNNKSKGPPAKRKRTE